MFTASGEYPILPLPAVLFPGTFLPLQITEDEHRRLLRDYNDENQLLGVILNPGQHGRSGQAVPCTVGCTASIALVLDQDDAKAMNVVLYGEQRMRVGAFTKQDPYYTAQIDLLEESLGEHAERRSKEASKLFQHYLELIRRRYGAHMVNLPLPDDPILASYLLATVLYLPLETKQHWLESSSVAVRLQEELAFLHAECEKIALLLALSHRTQHHYVLPDTDLFSSLFSQN